MASDIDEAVAAAGAAIGSDITYWHEADAKRFTGLELLAIAGGAALVGFIHGFSKKIGERAGEKLADSLVDYIAAKLGEAKDKDKDAIEQMIAEIRQEAINTIAEKHLDNDALKAAAEAVEKDLAEALLDGAPYAPDDVRSRIALAVRDAAMSLISDD